MAGSSLFGDVYAGIRTPDTVMNSGPLPPQEMGGMPYGLNGTPDARINYNSSLLGEIDAYAYGEPNRLSTQSSYINIPNRIQKVVPKIFIPGVSDADDNTLLTHAVDDGDVCFAWRDRFMKQIDERRHLDTVYTQRNYHPFINLATVNYLLAGLQMRLHEVSLAPSWNKLASLCLDEDAFDGANFGEGKTEQQKRALVTFLVGEVFTPFGIAHGSEKQGGNHEGTNAPVTWASNFVTTMYLDGYVRNLANLWRHCNVSAGQHLVLQLRERELPATYTLNHYHKATVVKSFTKQQRDDMRGHNVWQLVPDVTHSDTFSLREPYWRIAMSYVHSGAYADEKDCQTSYDDSALLRGALLEASFQPLFTSMLGEAPKPPAEPSTPPEQAEQAAQAFALPQLRAAAPASALDFKRYALDVGGKPAAVPPPPAATPPAPEPAPAKKPGKKRLQASVLGTSARGAVTLADVI